MEPKLFKPLEKLKKPIKGTDFYAACQIGHKEHDTKLVDVYLDGMFSKITDMPPVDQKFACDLQMKVYDWSKHFKTENGNETVPLYEKYCTGQDIISYCIDRQGVWEAYETLLILDILGEGKTNRAVLDFGSHIGWYTTLAAMAGYDVAAFDASEENLGMVRANAELNDVSEWVHTYLCWLDEEVPYLSAADEGVQLLKCDIEGAEEYAVQMCTELFENGAVKYAIFEVSPVFNGSYPALVRRIQDWGYDVYQIPGKEFEHNEAFSKRPVETIKKYCKLEGDLTDYINGLSQENFLFVRR